MLQCLVLACELPCAYLITKSSQQAVLPIPACHHKVSTIVVSRPAGYSVHMFFEGGVLCDIFSSLVQCMCWPHQILRITSHPV
jgi:hypothetical protein